jgi:hypothetical protein
VEVYDLSCHLAGVWRRESGSKMYPINDTILPSITAVADRKNHDSSMVVPTVLMGMLILGTVVAFSKTEAGKVEKIEKIKTIGQEPPVLESKIPFVGHLIGMLRWQVGYMQMLRYEFLPFTFTHIAES